MEVDSIELEKERWGVFLGTGVRCELILSKDGDFELEAECWGDSDDDEDSGKDDDEEDSGKDDGEEVSGKDDDEEESGKHGNESDSESASFRCSGKWFKEGCQLRLDIFAHSETGGGKINLPFRMTDIGVQTWKGRVVCENETFATTSSHLSFHLQDGREVIFS